MAKSTIDFSPLRKYRDFRNLWLSGLVSNLGTMITYVAVPFQIKEMTHSYLAVGISGAVELVPLIVFGLYGGVLADAVDRKKILWTTEALSMLLTAILLANSLLGDPHLILIYVVTGLFAAVNGVQKPSGDAILPRIVDHSDLPAAIALMSMRRQFGVIIGPSIGGVIIATFSTSAGYGVDVLSFLISLIFLAKVGSVPALATGRKTISDRVNGGCAIRVYTTGPPGDLSHRSGCDVSRNAQCSDSILGRSTRDTLGSGSALRIWNSWCDCCDPDEWMDEPIQIPWTGHYLGRNWMGGRDCDCRAGSLTLLSSFIFGTRRGIGHGECTFPINDMESDDSGPITWSIGRN